MITSYAAQQTTVYMITSYAAQQTTVYMITSYAAQQTTVYMITSYAAQQTTVYMITSYAAQQTTVYMITSYAAQQTSYDIYVTLRFPNLYRRFIHNPCYHETNSLSELSVWSSAFRCECNNRCKGSIKLCTTVFRSRSSTDF
jgi:hypothetical protein